MSQIIRARVSNNLCLPSGAYFNVLLAQSSLEQIEARAALIENQLAAAQRALLAGLGTRTDIDDAQARLDLNRARALGAVQQIAQAKHELEILIGRPVDRLRSLGANIPGPELLQPSSLDAWIQKAEMSSPELRVMKARAEAARIEVDRAEAGHKPTLDLVIQKSVSNSDSVSNPNAKYDNNQIGLQLSMPIYAGGYVSAQARQALAALNEAEQRYEAARRRLATQVRKEYQTIREGSLKVLALEAAERSGLQSLISNEKGFMAGTRTRIDILNASETLASTRVELAKERLTYLLAYLRLLGLSGALDRPAIQAVNRWLTE